MDVSDQEIKEMLDRLRQERAVRDARNDAYLQNNPKRSMLVQLGDSIDKFLTGQYAGDPGPYQATRNFGPGYQEAELRAGREAEKFRPGAGFPAQQAAPIVSDDANVGDSEYRRMAQQYGDAELKNALLNRAGDGANLADYYGAQRQLGDMVSADAEQGKAMEDYFMTMPGFDTREKAQAFIGANPAIAFREFNKANPMAMVGDKPAMIEEEAITDFMDTGLDRDEAIKRIRGGMPAQQESNIQQTAEAQPVERQAINNDSLNEIQGYMDTAVPGLGGKQMLSKNMMNLLRRQGRN
tara:strand:- start:18344 stop:19231 length:888 start_codon:yes stop_codon:yes gene_type:complete